MKLIESAKELGAFHCAPISKIELTLPVIDTRT